MSSIRHNPPPGSADPDDGYLDAARDTILAVGWRRTTLTDVAKRAGVSRMTIYRRWPDMAALLGDLLVREWSGLIEAVAGATTAPTPRTLADAVVATVAALRDNALFRKILDVDPELLLPYLLTRRGRNQDQVLDVLAAVVAAGQAAGTMRLGSPHALAAGLMLSLQGQVISPDTFTDLVDPAQRDAELTLLIERYLAP